jgi:type VI secretion system secreted protein VgrG
MAEKITQKHRQIAVDTPLGEDVLLLSKMTGTERLGQPFTYELELASQEVRIDANELLGDTMTVRLELAQGKYRHFNGLVSRFSKVGMDGGLTYYRATLSPWLLMLSQTADCRIFQEKKVPDIIQEVFRDHSSDFELRLSREYRVWDYCVQYRETDFNFVSRLMEQEGIYYYFQHEDDKHTLVLADDIGEHDRYPDYETIPYYPPTKAGIREDEHVSDWSVDYQVLPGAVALNDFDFKNPKLPNSRLKAVSQVNRDHAAADGEIFDYPGEYEKQDEGQEYAEARIQAIQCDFEVARGKADARGISCGYTFELSKHPDDDQNREYLITGATYELQSDMSELDQATGEAGDKAVFSCGLTAIDSGVRFVPSRTTLKPTIRGPQTAIVAGGEKEKIEVDEYGRVKVQFHWDRYGKGDLNSSCWVRVSQNAAGNHWGGMFIPHVGQEVIVDFLEGDPDRPIITGRVYNADNMPPIKLPDAKHKSILRDDYGNELIFDATPGDEHIMLYSPHHASGVELGRSCALSTSSDSAELFLGSKTELSVGAKTEFLGGSATSSLLGINTEFKTFSSIEAFAGLSAELRYGPNIEITAQDKIHSADKDWLLQAGSDIILDCEGDKKGKVVIAAGPQRESVMEMGEELLSLKVGKAKRSLIDTTIQDNMEFSIKFLCFLMLAAHAAHIAGVGLSYGLLRPDPSKEDDESKKKADAADALNMLISAPLHGATLGAHLMMDVAILYLWKSQLKPDNVKDDIAKHEATAKLQMKKGGEVDLRGSKEIMIAQHRAPVVKDSKGDSLVWLHEDGVTVSTDQEILLAAPDISIVGSTITFNGKKVDVNKGALTVT